MTPRTLLAWTLGAAAALALPSAAAAAVQSSPAAKVESQTRPNFGLLLEPPAGRTVYGRRPPSAPAPLPPRDWVDAATVDCDTVRDPREAQRALDRLRPGGVLLLRTRGGRPCSGGLVVTRSVTILGEGSWRWRTDEGEPKAVIQAEPGRPCISVVPGVRNVQLRGLVLDSQEGGRVACVEAWRGEIEMRETVVRYQGSGPAVFVEGGTLAMDDVRITSQSWQAAVVAADTTVNLRDVTIVAAYVGLDVGAVERSKISGVQLRAYENDQSSLRGQPASGLIVRPGFDGVGGGAEITDIEVQGFRTGVNFHPGTASSVSYGMISGSEVGVMVEGGQVRVSEMMIGAREVGVYVRDGWADVRNSTIYGVANAAVYAHSSARFETEPYSIWVYPGPWGVHCGFMYARNYDRRGQVCRPYWELPRNLQEEVGVSRRAKWRGGWNEWRDGWNYERRYFDWRGRSSR